MSSFKESKKRQRTPAWLKKKGKKKEEEKKRDYFPSLSQSDITERCLPFCIECCEIIHPLIASWLLKCSSHEWSITTQEVWMLWHPTTLFHVQSHVFSIPYTVPVSEFTLHFLQSISRFKEKTQQYFSFNCKHTLTANKCSQIFGTSIVCMEKRRICKRNQKIEKVLLKYIMAL